MNWDEFRTAYLHIIHQCVAMLKDNTFATFVVGDMRDGDGFYRNFVGLTADLFEDAGMKLYNEAILVTTLGSLPIRTGKHFADVRKLGKAHQNVLTFVKGDPKIAAQAVGDVEIMELVTTSEEDGNA
ncbi:MAG: hypothetical protein JRD89_15605 [Deltaproteobacteria bacterium]|nr:hypothetical protein [Deltaproteobacteria bacterium]